MSFLNTTPPFGPVLIFRITIFYYTVYDNFIGYNYPLPIPVVLKWGPTLPTTLKPQTVHSNHLL